MGVIRYLNDKLVNLVANLGTDRDKASGSTYAPVILTDEQLVNAYRGAWLPRKIVDIPALDATRKWRSWQADRSQIEKIEADEIRLGLRAKVKEALIKARLFGGAAIYIGTGDRDPSKPLDPRTVRRGGVKYLAVMTRRQLSPTEIETDPMQPLYGRPKAYRMTGSGASTLEIHPSRLVLFRGAEHPEPDLVAGPEYGWGDSILQSVMESVKQSDSTMANVASMVFEAKVDVVRIPGFMEGLKSKEYEKRVQERVRLAALMKSINGMLVMDKEEEYDSKEASFGGLPDVMDRFLQAVAGAADIPATRLLGQSPAGLNSSGESDLRNYYDRVEATQTLDIASALSTLDECLIRSALGDRPAEIYFAWRPLWQPTAKERSDIGKTTADTIKAIKETGLFPEDALSKASATLLVENDVVPGLESAIKDLATEQEGESDETDPTARLAVADAAPRTLYVSRKVINAADILRWAAEQGFESALPADDLHVTIAYSREPVDWMKVGEAWNGENGTTTVPPGGARLIEQFGGGAVVLLFNSSELAWRHMGIREAGASWDWPEYQPHITITYQPGDVDLSRVEPYRGPIELGPEIFEEVNEDWKSSVKE